jgi:hypothetical protein
MSDDSIPAGAPYNPIRASTEVLTAMRDIHALIVHRQHDARRRMTEAEAEYEALLKLGAFAEQAVTEAAAALERAKEAARAT